MLINLLILQEKLLSLMTVTFHLVTTVRIVGTVARKKYASSMEKGCGRHLTQGGMSEENAERIFVE